jgi:NADPH:quinone reductase-like Zn-dependent oxidoreductase
VVEDFLDDNDYFGASRVVISSASSKTAIGSAFLAARRRGREIVALTSQSNVEFCRSLGCYDTVLTYDEVRPCRASRRPTLTSPDVAT